MKKIIGLLENILLIVLIFAIFCWMCIAINDFMNTVLEETVTGKSFCIFLLTMIACILCYFGVGYVFYRLAAKAGIRYQVLPLQISHDLSNEPFTKALEKNMIHAVIDGIYFTLFFGFIDWLPTRSLESAMYYLIISLTYISGFFLLRMGYYLYQKYRKKQEVS